MEAVWVQMRALEMFGTFMPVLFMIGVWKCHLDTWLYTRIILTFYMWGFVEAMLVQIKYPTINQSRLLHNKAGARTLATKKKTQGALMDPTLSGKIQNTKVRGWNPNDLNDWFLLNKNNKCHWHVWYCLHGSHILCQISLYDDFCLW